MKVYAVILTDDETQVTDAVFSTAELAQSHVEDLVSLGTPRKFLDIHEWVVDGLVKSKERECWTAYVHLTEDRSTVGKEVVVADVRRKQDCMSAEEFLKYYHWSGKNSCVFWAKATSFVSPEHALELATSLKKDILQLMREQEE